MTEDLNLDLGPFAPAIVKQLADQGVKPRQPYFLTLWERRGAEIDNLDFCNLLTEAEAKRARQRLLSRIAANVEKLP